MPINTIEFATKMTGELDKAIVHKAVTGFMADNALQAKFVGAKIVTIPDVSMSGLGDYDRDTGFTRGSITVDHKPYELTQERGRTFQLDRMDSDESGVANLAGQVLGEFTRTKVVPEIDAYVLSKLAGLAVTENMTVTGAPATKALKMLNDAIQKVQNEVGYDESLVAFVDSTFWAALQNTTEISRHLTVSEFKKGDICTEVKHYNGVPILPVPDSRMKTAYTFNDGETEGQEAGGFTPADNASNIGLLVMVKRAPSLIKKTEKVRVFTPEQNLGADAWKFDYRLYYDVLVKNSLKKAFCAYTYTAAT